MRERRYCLILPGGEAASAAQAKRCHSPAMWTRRIGWAWTSLRSHRLLVWVKRTLSPARIALRARGRVAGSSVAAPKRLMLMASGATCRAAASPFFAGFSGAGGAFAAPFPIVQGQRGEPLQFVVRGVDLTRVAGLAKELHTKLSTEHPELGYVDLDLKLDLPQFKLHIDRVRAASLGLNAATVSQAVNLLMGGQDVAYFNDEPGDGERYDVRVKAVEGQVTRPEHLRRIYLRSGSGELVRADTIASFEERLGPALIARYDLRYAANFYAEPKLPLNEAVAIVQEAAGQLPEGYEVTMVRQTKDFADTVRILTGTFGLAVVLLYMVLASQFNSLVQPFIIMVAQPLAAVGALFSLWLFDMTLNIYSMIGMVLLVGLVAKNSILLVDLANQLRVQGKSIDEALLDACPVRLRPVLMTSLTIILAMLPAALGFGTGFEANGPLAVTIIGGMISSTVLTLLVVPALYSLSEHGLARLRQRTGRALPATRSA